MNIRVFNICLLVGWLMVTGGGYMLQPAIGLLLGGFLLLGLTVYSASMAGVHASKRRDGEAG